MKDFFALSLKIQICQESKTLTYFESFDFESAKTQRRLALSKALDFVSHLFCEVSG